MVVLSLIKKNTIIYLYNFKHQNMEYIFLLIEGKNINQHQQPVNVEIETVVTSVKLAKQAHYGSCVAFAEIHKFL